MTSTALIATTTRPILFTYHGDNTNRALVTDMRWYLAGTEVEVRKLRDNGEFTARVLGTLYMQECNMNDVMVP